MKMRFRQAFKEVRRAMIFPTNLNPVWDTDVYKAVVLYALCRHLGPEVVIETGVARGTSSAGILLGLQLNDRGRLYSVDLPEATYRKDDMTLWKDSLLGGTEPGWIVPSWLRARWSLFLGESRAILPAVVDEVGEVDLFYHDSEHTAHNVMFELEMVWGSLSPEGIIVVDNINWNDAFDRFCATHRLRWAVLFPYVGITRKQPSPPGWTPSTEGRG